MKNRSFVVLTLCITQAHGFTFSDKTFLTPRSQSAHMAVESSIWHRHTTNDMGNSFGMTLQATGFYRHSDNETGLGHYFGTRGRNTIVIKSTQNSTPPLADFPAESIVHNPETMTSALDATITLRPEQEVYGLLLGAYQDLGHILEGLSFKIIAPLVHVDNSLNAVVAGEVTTEDGFSIADYFRGGITQTTENRLQVPLKFLKIDGSESKTMFADILATLSYNFVEEEYSYASLGVGITIPTDNDANSLHLFEPILGSGNHLGLHVGADGSTVIIQRKDYSIEFMWRFLFTHFLS